MVMESEEEELDPPPQALPTCSACTLDLSLALRGKRLKRPPMRLRGRRSLVGGSSRLRFNDEALDQAGMQAASEVGRGSRVMARPAWPRTAPTIPLMLYKSDSADVSVI